MGAGILPLTIYRGTLYLLLGQERNNNLWSDFGGSSHKYEKPFKTAIREGTEELNGFFGTEEEMHEEVENNKLLTLSYDKYTTYAYYIHYNKHLPRYFINNNKFIEKQVPSIVSSKTNGLYEKKSIKWFSCNELENFEIIRPHFREHIRSILKNRSFLLSEIKNLKKKK